MDGQHRDFSYEQAFSRNVGWVTQAEQAQLKSKRVAIAGLGGVGGFHLQTLARLGIGEFSIADFDVFDIVNFNRQAGAMMSTLGRRKIDVLAEQTRDINPEVDLRLFDQGVTADNLDDFLRGADLYVDGLDFFAFEARRATFAACARLGIPAVTAAPLGMSTALLVFLPGAMTFEEYFQLDGLPELEQAVHFLVGLAPAAMHIEYLVDPTRLDLANRRGPSTPMACYLCAGVAATEGLKIMLGRGDVLAAPWAHQFDAFSNRLKRTRRENGNSHPLQRRRISALKKQVYEIARLQGLIT
ncbi:MAG: ThiF family adenylyltransferase [Rhodocyclaceae bacterium]|nr:ThiF family adenylyltransferase [Rhodocyclaceae bacterium]